MIVPIKIKQAEKAAIRVIRNLRESKLKNGIPFMINTNSLPSHQCYLEYPNGLIVLASLCRLSIDFKVIAEYSYAESDLIRKKYKLDKFSLQ
jgi:hypothetical protein